MLDIMIPLQGQTRTRSANEPSGASGNQIHDRWSMTQAWRRKSLAYEERL